jgi:UDP-galactopyranose mutase
MYDWLIVGAGFAGSVLAERLASQRDQTVLLIDRRPHIGGNAYDRIDEAGLLVHVHGPHVFHTNARAVFDYLSAFTAWRAYEHRVLAEVDELLLPLPINVTTINRLYRLSLKADELADYLATHGEPIASPANFEDELLVRFGRDIYEKFFCGYTRKQWGLDPAQLDRSLAARIPLRLSDDDRYFTDAIQCMPAKGFTRLFENMLRHRNITVMTSTSFQSIRASVGYRRLIYTGPIDEYFGFSLGRLPYRSLRFEHLTLDRPSFQPAAVVNYPQSARYTRITEHKKLTGQSHRKTTVTYEYPTDTGEAYYPIPRPENAALFKRYQALARRQDNVWFVGRLATYQYLNMDQAVGQALATFRRIAARL